MWKDFFYFSNAEKRAIIILLVLISIITIAHIALYLYKEEYTITQSDTFKEEYSQFLRAIKEQETANRNSGRAHSTRSKLPTAKNNRPTTLVPFDPNTADSLLLYQLGLPTWMIRNVLRYRDKGGVFRKPEDFSKIYGLTEEQLAVLLPYIHIDDAFKPKKKEPKPQHTAQTPPNKVSAFKYPTGTTISLNHADTTELKKIPGIGSYTAKKIVNYRKRLGGFYHIEQLQDVGIEPNKFAPWFIIESEEITRIHINKVSAEQLKAHPYINFYQAKRIVEYRKRKGNLKQLDQLALYEEFTEKDLERISPYVTY